MRPALLTTRLRALVTPFRIFCVFAVSVALFGPSSLTQPQLARAATVLGTTTYNSNTTWTSSGSPYILNGNVTVSSGVTLTVQPGVVVKLNGASRTITVNGTLSAVGSSSARITFTSYQDDTVGGDSNGDGAATTGAVGQWYRIRLLGSSDQNELDFVDVRYGGGTITDNSAAVIDLTNGCAEVSIFDSTIKTNKSPGFRAFPSGSCTPGAVVKRATIEGNGAGAVVVDGFVDVDESLIKNNTRQGFYFGSSLGFTGPASSITDSEITGNNYGVYILMDSDVDVAYWPRGTRNNIYGNTTRQLHTFETKRTATWPHNYWGADVEFRPSESACQGVGVQTLGRLAFHSSPLNAPVGPINAGGYVGGSSACYYDGVAIGQIEYSPFPFVPTPTLPMAQSLGSEFAVNPSATVSDPVNSATGSFTHSVGDLSLPGVGVTFAFARSYNSLDPTVGSLGAGWTHSYAISLSFDAWGDATARAGSGQRFVFLRNTDGSFTAAAGGRATLEAVTGGHELVSSDQLHYVFNSSGKLTSLRDRNAQGLAFGYDGSGRLATVTDEAAREATLTYDGSGRLTEVEVPDGRSVGYGYTSGRLTSVTDVRGKVWTYVYESKGLLEKEIDPLTHTVFRNVYGSDGRVIEQYDALNHKTEFAWNAGTQTLTATDARNNEWQDVYDGNLLVKRIDPLGNETEFAYDDDFNLTSVTDARDKTTTMTYDSDGNLLSRTVPSPLSYEETFTYNSLNDLTAFEDGRGNSTTLGYDGAGNLTTITAPGSVVTTLGRDPGGTGLLVSVTDPRGKTTEFEHDSAGNLIAVETPLGKRQTATYDSTGRVISVVDPRGNESGIDADDYRSTVTYNAAGSPLILTDPLSNVMSWVYDDAARLTSITDARSKTIGYAYDNANRLTTVTAPGSTTTSYAYDGVGNLTSRTDAKSHATTYTYDAANRPTGVTNALSKSWAYEYDANGNLIEQTDAASDTTAYAYDALNRLTSIDYSDSTPDVGYSYDANSNRTEMTDGAGSVSYVYDALNRLTETTRGSDSFEYDYDAASNLTERTYPGGRLTEYAYDDDSRLATVSSNSQLTSYFYDAAANLIETELPSGNGYAETRSYDEAGRVTEVRNEKSGVALSYAQYAYNGVGNPSQIVTGAGTTTYGYDDLNRLTSASGGGLSLSYAYDNVGNRTSETRSAGTTTYSYNNGDQLTQTSGPGGTVTYGYDDNGNQTTAGSRTFSYDLAGRLTSTTLASTTTTYAYDGDGVRLNAATGSQTTNYLWDVNNGLPQLALERDGSGATTRSYLQGLGPVSLTDSSQTSYYHRDALGSVVNVTSSTGAAQWTHSYEPFGAANTSTQNDPGAPANPLRFTGEHLDDTGLYHLRARQYDPGTGRFTAPDPLAPSGAAPGISTYAYADNTPTSLIDPSGMGAIWAWNAARAGMNCGGSASHEDIQCTLAWFKNWVIDCLHSPACLLGTAVVIAIPYATPLIAARLGLLSLQMAVRLQTFWVPAARGVYAQERLGKIVGPFSPGHWSWGAGASVFVYHLLRDRIGTPSLLRLRRLLFGVERRGF